MENKPLLSIAIPTWNRASFLENLLNNILPQLKKTEGEVEVCISNNSSTDNTREVAMKFKEKYPDLIKYNENKVNLGVDRNILKVIGMSQGDFVWLFGDDDCIADNGLNKVINFIKENCREDTGLIILRLRTYFIDKQTGKRTILVDTSDKNKPKAFEIDKKDIIGLSFPSIAFISILVFNNKPLKKMLIEDKALMEQGVGTSHIQMALFALMFLKYHYLNGIVFNEVIVNQEMPQYYKYSVEDKFMLHYKMQKKLNNLLLSNKYMNDDYSPLIIKRDRRLRREFITDMMVMRTFKTFNCFSYSGCLRLFFQQAMFIDALLFSFVFLILFLIPPKILTSLYKVLLMIKYGKKWRFKWDIANSISSIAIRAARREIT